MPKPKERYTIWIDPDVLAAARARAGPNGSVSEVLADAAKRTLLGSADDDRAALLRAVDRVFHAVRQADDRRAFELRTVQEMLGLSVLTFLNHTPAVAEADKRAALVSGKLRFERFLDVLADNLRRNRSVLQDVADPPGPADGDESPAMGPTTADVEDDPRTDDDEPSSDTTA